MEYLLSNNRIGHVLSIPFIWVVVVPFLFLDICVETYHRVCFPLYGLPLVNRSQYIVFDRYKLGYLSKGQKVNCVYCAYVNGLLRYVTEIAARTEQYWCAIKHAKENGIYPQHHKNFLPYGDKNAFVKRYIKPQNTKNIQKPKTALQIND